MKAYEYLATIPTFNSTDPICVTRPAFLSSHSVILNIQESFNLFKFQHKYKITSKCNKLSFKCRGKFVNPICATKTLLDKNGNPIVRFWRDSSSLGSTFYVYDWETGRELCKFNTNAGRLLRLTLRVEFLDFITGRKRLLVLKGDWEKKEALIFLGDPDEIKGGARLVAKIFRKPGLRRSDEYTVEIAANVDVAIVAILTIVFDTIKDNVQIAMAIPNIPIPRLMSNAK
ncbi:unnamed protein product [Orchesella dallaii]|uniref:Tubby C-terminal-like domain-containing protein n=1 Tax=Orchesella dallaii TaxID=48710 RepID=A0ABP1RVN2_9HEXA